MCERGGDIDDLNRHLSKNGRDDTGLGILSIVLKTDNFTDLEPAMVLALGGIYASLYPLLFVSK